MIRKVFDNPQSVCKDCQTPDVAQLNDDKKAINKLSQRLEDKAMADETWTEGLPEFNDMMKDFDKLIGLEKVKKLVYELYAYVIVQRQRQKYELNNEAMVLHMVFKGNPGTGKTTVARYFGKMFQSLALLPKGHLVEVERADLVGEYIGHTAQKTREQIKRAMGGILFVDEAYSLGRGGEKDFGKEAIDTLVKAMEDHKKDLIIILAGYKKEMDFFLHLNPGLNSRFPIQIEYDDYTTKQLVDIANGMMTERDYKLSDSASDKLVQIINARRGYSAYHFGNARYVRNLIEKAIRKQAMRLINQEKFDRDDLITIDSVDLSV